MASPRLAAVALALLAAARPAAADDGRLRLQTIAAVQQYDRFTIFDDVQVAAHDGAVTLSGKVTSVEKKRDLVRMVASLDGVRSVSDRIAVLPASASDDALRQRLARGIYGHANFWSYAVMPDPPIHIIVEHQHVTLTGVVRSEADRALARALALQSQPRTLSVELRTDASLRRQ
jgi:hypothetical protein